MRADALRIAGMLDFCDVKSPDVNEFRFNSICLFVSFVDL
jgi:hypothetical protein